MKKTLIAMIVFLLMVGLVAADEWPVCIDMIAPDAPSGLSMSGKTLSWNEADDDPSCSGIDYYEVYRDDVLLGTSSSTSFDDDVADGTYTYKVIAYDLAGNKGASVSKSFTIGTTGGGGGGSSGGGGGSSSGGGGSGTATTTTTQNGGGSGDTTTTTSSSPTTTELSQANLGGGSDDEPKETGSEGAGDAEKQDDDGEQEERSGLLGLFGSPLSGGNSFIGWAIVLLVVIGGTFIFFLTRAKKTP